MTHPNEAGRPPRSDGLDQVVVNMELTLISIIQGVALTFLVESSRDIVAGLRFEFWPYVLSGLLIILIWWSRALLHTFTVIGWPLDFRHNFLYIASALVEAVMFTRIADPAGWFAAGTAFSLLIWLLFILDRRLIRHRFAGVTSPAAEELRGALWHEQALSVRYWMPMTCAFYAASAGAIRLWPDVFLAQHGHVAIASLQLAGGIANLVWVIRFYRSIAGSIAALHAE